MGNIKKDNLMAVMTDLRTDELLNECSSVSQRGSYKLIRRDSSKRSSHRASSKKNYDFKLGQTSSFKEGQNL